MLQATKCTQSPLLLCGTISFIAMRGANVCWETSANAVPTQPRDRALPCPAPRLQRKMLPELGIKADHLSKAGLKDLNNEHCTSPSTSAETLHHPSTSFYFAMPHSLMAKRLMHSAT